MSHQIINELGVHLNQRTQILEDMVSQSSSEAAKPRQSSGSTSEMLKHSKVSVMLDRFLEICPAD